MIGVSRMSEKQEKNLSSLSMLLGNEDNFADMFKDTATDRKTYTARPKKQLQAESNQIEFLMQNSKKFQYNDREHNYDNIDPWSLLEGRLCWQRRDRRDARFFLNGC